MRTNRKPIITLTLLLVLGMVLSACAPAVEPTNASSAPAVSPSATDPAEATSEVIGGSADPKSGGTMVYALTGEPLTLDAAKNDEGYGDAILRFIGASLIAKDKDNNYVPWLAKSWESSADGLTWTFQLREDVKFHDGTSLTAGDFVYTYQRVLDPNTMAGMAGQMLSLIDAVSAPDDYTLVLTLREPSFYVLDTLTSVGFTQPTLQSWVEKEGENYGHNPISVGPYKVKEWVTGDHVTLEANPDYHWAPAYAHQGPPYIQELVFRFIPEIATIVAGLETGEIDYVHVIDSHYLARLEATGTIEIHKIPNGTMIVDINNSAWPFDEVKVRQAFNYATDRESALAIGAAGLGTVISGPLAPGISGYDPAVEDSGYNLDLDKAKSLMAEAGWSEGADGILIKDGQRLEFDLFCLESEARLAQVLVEQWKELGAAVNISQVDQGLIYDKMISGDYVSAISGYNWGNAEVLNLVYGAPPDGFSLIAHISDPELNDLFVKMSTEMDPDKQQEFVTAAQLRMIEQANIISIYSSHGVQPISKRVKGFYHSDVNLNDYFEDVYISEGEQ